MRKEVDIDTFVLRRAFGTITELITDGTGTIFIMLSISRKTMILLFFLIQMCHKYQFSIHQLCPKSLSGS